METLVLVEQHKNQFCSRSKAKDHARFGSSPTREFVGINCRTFESGYGVLPTPLRSQSFNENPHKKTSPRSNSIPVNGKGCRKDLTFDEDLSGGSLFPTPLKSESFNGNPDRKTTPKSNPIPINGKVCRKELTFDEDFSGGNFLPTPLKSRSFNENPDRKITSKSNPVPINGKACRKEIVFDEDLSGGSFLLSELWAGPTYSNSPPPSSLPIPKFTVRPKRTVSLDLPGSSSEIELRIMAKSAPSSPNRERLSFTSDLFDNADSATKTLRRILNLNLDNE